MIALIAAQSWLLLNIFRIKTIDQPHEALLPSMLCSYPTDGVGSEESGNGSGGGGIECPANCWVTSSKK